MDWRSAHRGIAINNGAEIRLSDNPSVGRHLHVRTCGSLTAGTAWCGNARNGRGKSTPPGGVGPVVLVAKSVALLIRSSAVRDQSTYRKARRSGVTPIPRAVDSTAQRNGYCSTSPQLDLRRVARLFGQLRRDLGADEEMGPSGASQEGTTLRSKDLPAWRISPSTRLFGAGLPSRARTRLRRPRSARKALLCPRRAGRPPHDGGATTGRATQLDRIGRNPRLTRITRTSGNGGR